MYLDLDLDLGYRSGCGEINPREKKNRTAPRKTQKIQQKEEGAKGA